MTATAESRRVDRCRICGGTDLVPYLDLGEMPLANDLRQPDETEPETRFPLAVLFCPDCGLSQLSVVVSAERMFRHYRYRSSISKTFKRHCASLAEEASKEAGLAEGALVADIGSNDGPLLGAFLERGYKTVGIDPARNLAEIARAGGIDVLSEFWGREAAETLVEEWGRPSLMTATNVFAHVDDLDDFMGGIAHALADDGRFMLEVPYLSDLVEKNEFDTVYHEHLSYFLLRPLLKIAEKHGLTPAYVRRIPVHGGGLRVYLKRGERPDVYPDSVRAVLDFERDAGLYETQPYERFAREIDSIRRDVRQTLGRLRGEGKTIAAFGASAKGAVLLNAVDADAETISFIVDDTPEKQGLIAPGTGVPVVPAEKLTEEQPDFLLILAWNFIDEILDRTKAFREAGGRYIVPVPALRYID